MLFKGGSTNLLHCTQADAIMAKFDGDGDGKLDYQVLKPVFNIRGDARNNFQKNFFIAFLNS